MAAATLQSRYEALAPHFDERTERLWCAAEAHAMGRGGVSAVQRATGVSRPRIMRGIIDLHHAPLPSGDTRRKGGGRKKLSDKDESLLSDIDAIIEPKGDPMSLLQWTTKSLDHLVTALARKKHVMKRSALALLLRTQGFSLKANKKNIEGVSHPDRDLQFRHIKETCTLFEKKGDPIISVDCKKKELIGAFKNGGREWRGKGQDTVVNVYDFQSLADGKAAPYGIYDIVHNTGFVNVGVDHDTASFAVESIRRWWVAVGKKLYAGKKELLITSDGGGSNGVRNRLWKKELQQLANETKLSITVNHFPPATSKWNRIEHRLFSYTGIGA